MAMLAMSVGPAACWAQPGYPNMMRTDFANKPAVWMLIMAWSMALSAVGVKAAAGGEVAFSSALYTVDSWENDDGLPQNSVIAMTQTRDGYLWLGTINGLARFDGRRRFTVFDEDNTPGLGSSPIVGLFEDSRGSLWIGSELSGVLVARDGKVTGLGIGQGNPESRLRTICEDASGAVWLTLHDGQLWRCGDDGVTNRFLAVPERVDGYRAAISDSEKRVWIGTDQSTFAVSATSDFGKGELRAEIPRASTSLKFLVPSRAGGYWRFGETQVERWDRDGAGRVFATNAWLAPVSAACEDDDGNLLVGTRGEGVFRIDAKGQTTPLFTNRVIYVLSMLVDRENTLWVGTDGNGLLRLKQRLFQVVEPSRGLTVRSVAEDGSGGVWMGFNAFDFSSASIGYLKDGGFRGYGRQHGLFNSSVFSVLVDGGGTLWAGTRGALFSRRETNFVLEAAFEGLQPPVFAIHEARDGRLWFGTAGGLVWRDGSNWGVFGMRDGLSSDNVTAVVDDRDGNVWAGTQAAGLNRVRDRKVQVLRKADGLPSDEVSSLYVDAEGVLWVGTRVGGLACLRQGTWKQFSTKDGLVSNHIGCVIEDGLGYLWIGSNAGLMRVARKSLLERMPGARQPLDVRSFGRPDGLPTRECAQGSQPGAAHGRDGRLWFPTQKGLVSVDPSKITSNTNPPPVNIESVVVDGQEQGLTAIRSRQLSSLTLSPRREHLEIAYTSLNLASPERAQFRYRLIGHESDWVDAGDSRVVHYSKLPPGEYQFQVKAANEDGIWSVSPAELTIVVEPPFYMTWWFLGVVVASVLGMVAGVVHYISTQKLQRQLADMRQQEALEKERSRIARDIHDQLGANLTQVSLLGELIEGDREQPEEVSSHAKQIQATALETSRALDQIVWTVNPSNDTLDGLVNYVCKYAQEYLALAGLKYRLDVPADLPSTPITPEIRHNLFLAAKEAINNVVKHAQAESAWLRLKLEPGQFTIEIQDDGKGPSGMNEQRARSRNGLRNMGKRLEDVGGKFEIGPAPERGTLVRLVAPLGKH